ncbi:DUF4190 domain-containing protein [Candidatus Pacearchaeota archaeon]|nr:DUF4190 domain-containing protein [Candidatus Pacearchaeota archaeon]
MAKDGDTGEVSYVLGIISIVMAFFQPIAGFVFGIIGFLQSRKHKNPVSEKAKKLSIIGIIISIIVVALSLFAGFYLTKLGILKPSV